MRKHKALMTTLERALSTCRPHGEPTTYAFTFWLASNVPDRYRKHMHFDDECNVHIDARKLKRHKTLFVAHVDTVHRKPGVNHITKSPTHWRAGSKGQCLGADDGAGVALLMHMLHHDVPGYYIFTQGEECGGIGAKFLADNNQALLKQFDRAIAFDRKDVFDVITHQAGGRCCSDAFAQALADALNATCPDMLMYMPSNGGVYTDTAEFTADIPECTNISVGYDGAHGDTESLDMVHYQQLSCAVLAIDWDGLPTQRDPKVVEVREYYTSSYDPSWHKWDKWDATALQDWGTTKASPGSVATWSRETELYAALADARDGRMSDLLSMMAEAAHPSEPELARRLINRHAIDKDMLDWIEVALDQGEDADMLLEEVFEAVQTQ